ncbi:type II toxin-antitoxin system RelE/ParE family toxin [Thiomonas sp.]
MQVRFLRKALQNLDEEASYIAKDSQAAARCFAEAVETNLAHLARHPSMGRPGRVHGTRELVMTDFPYIIPYRVRGECLEVLRIFHAMRKPPKKW